MIPRPPATLTRHELNQTPTPCRGSQAPTMFVQVPFAFASRPTTASIQASKASKAASTIKDRHLNHHHHQWAVRAKETYPAMHRPAVPQQHKSGSLPCPGMTGAKTLTEHVKAQHLPPEQCRRMMAVGHIDVFTPLHNFPHPTGTRSSSPCRRHQCP